MKANDKILIHGVAGGVGHIALQLAKHLGAIVYGTVLNQQQARIAKALGADAVIFADQESVEEYVDQYTNGKGFDIVLDPVGGNNLVNSFKAVIDTSLFLALLSHSEMLPRFNWLEMNAFSSNGGTLY